MSLYGTLGGTAVALLPLVTACDTHRAATAPTVLRETISAAPAPQCGNEGNPCALEALEIVAERE